MECGKLSWIVSTSSWRDHEVFDVTFSEHDKTVPKAVDSRTVKGSDYVVSVICSRELSGILGYPTMRGENVT